MITYSVYQRETNNPGGRHKSLLSSGYEADNFPIEKFFGTILDAFSDIYDEDSRIAE